MLRVLMLETDNKNNNGNDNNKKISKYVVSEVAMKVIEKGEQNCGGGS